MKKLILIFFILFLSNVMLTGCLENSKSENISDEVSSYEPMQRANIDLGSMTIYNYVSLRASFIEEKPSQDDFEEGLDFFPYNSLSTEEMIDSEIEYIKNHCNNSVLETLQSFDLDLIETVEEDHEYIYDVTERISVLYSGADSAVVEERKWRFNVVVDDDEIYFNELLFISSITLDYSELTEEEKENIKIENIVGNKLNEYFDLRVKATHIDRWVFFDDLAGYFYPGSVVKENEEKFISEQYDMQLERSLKSCDIVSVKSINSTNYQAKVVLTQNVSKIDGSISETTCWLVDVNISNSGILITNIMVEE